MARNTKNRPAPGTSRPTDHQSPSTRRGRTDPPDRMGRPGRKNKSEAAHDALPPEIQREHRDSRKNAIVSTTILFIVFLAAFLLAPLLDATEFWQDHFAEHTARTGLLLYAPILLVSTLARTWRPMGWESELLARGSRSLAHATVTWWLLAPLLEAPRLAAVAVFPFLIATPLLTLQVARQSGSLPPEARRLLLLAAAPAVASAILLAAVIWTDPPLWLLASAALPLAGILIAAPPLGVARIRSTMLHPPGTLNGPATASVAGSVAGTVAGPSRSPLSEDPHPLDLPAGTLRPPTGPLRILLTLGGLLLVLLVVAPGLPLTATIAWGALVLALPLLLHALVTRQGVAHPRALVGPPLMRRHEHRIMMIGDETLEELDDAIERFLRWGTGRAGLAQKISTLLQQADPDATPERLEAQLNRLPRLPWSRRRREDGLVALLRTQDRLHMGARA